jgi:hypothetical protein
MGYRSDVVLAVGKEAMPAFMTALSRCPTAASFVFKEHDDMIKDYQGDGNILVRWSGIKWYAPGYPEVDAVQAFVSDPEQFLPEEVLEGEPDIYDCYKFVRIGDETDDIEQHGGGFWDIYIERSITY